MNNYFNDRENNALENNALRKSGRSKNDVNLDDNADLLGIEESLRGKKIQIY